ncbi:hypothetical protein WS89_27160 [Burkholderia sp. MSMB1072]|nr:hypothetical protein WS89_27160 [Burkholderia sp. MSMB1072]
MMVAARVAVPVRAGARHRSICRFRRVSPFAGADRARRLAPSVRRTEDAAERSRDLPSDRAAAIDVPRTMSSGVSRPFAPNGVF